MSNGRMIQQQLGERLPQPLPAPRRGDDDVVKVSPFCLITDRPRGGDERATFVGGADPRSRTRVRTRESGIGKAAGPVRVFQKLRGLDRAFLVEKTVQSHAIWA